jgi:probable F420-dependent oxidoreductase
MSDRAKLQLAVATPVVTMTPRGHARWEETATIAQVARIAEAGDRLHYHHLTCSEHIGVPPGQVGRRGTRYWDPLATFGYLSAKTERIRFATNVLVLGYHHPLAIAKRYGTLDLISGGRLILGVGVGTLEEEFDLLGVPFRDRGERADDAISALKSSLSKSDPSYAGRYYSFHGLVVDPCAVQERVPIWVGGRTLRSLQRAVTLADGWCPFAISPQQAQQWLRQVNLPQDFDVRLWPRTPLDPAEEPEAAADILGELAEAGATIAEAHLVHHSFEHYLGQLEALVAVNATL